MLPMHTHQFTTGNPFTRRCVKCGTEDFVNSFRVPMSEAQAQFNRLGVVDVEGIELVDGKYLRGYTRRFKPDKRLVIGRLCIKCRTRKKVPNHEGNSTYKEVARQIRYKRSVIAQLKLWSRYKCRDPIDKQKRLAYCTEALLLLHAAAAKARDRRRQGIKCPPRWEHLLPEKHRVSLSTLHAAILWTKRVPEVY